MKNQKNNVHLNANASEFISILTCNFSDDKGRTSELNAKASEFKWSGSWSAPCSAPSSPPGLSRSVRRMSLPVSCSTFNSPPPCNIQSWWFENKSLFDDSYDDMKKIFGWSKVPIKKVLKVGELKKLNIEKEYPSKKITSPLSIIKEESSYAAIVLRKQNILR